VPHAAGCMCCRFRFLHTVPSSPPTRYGLQE
jgi:hypothetical protein